MRCGCEIDESLQTDSLDRQKSAQFFWRSLRTSGFFVAKSRARKLKFVEAIQSNLGCRFSAHEYFAF
jgi:hypothetical protein